MTMRRWIVNASERTVRDSWVLATQDLKPGEFFWTGTPADAMAAGARRRLADEALSNTPGFVLVADRIEPQADDVSGIRTSVEQLRERLHGLDWDVWREGTGLVVLGRL